MAEAAYPALEAGLGFEFYRSNDGFLLLVKGYSDKLGTFAVDMLRKIKSFRVEQSELDVCKEVMMRNLENFFHEQPREHATYWTEYLFQRYSWSTTEKIAALERKR